MENKELDMTAGLEKLKTEKPANASAYVEKQLNDLAPQIMELIDKGYTYEQYYENLSAKALKEIGLDQKAFVKKLKTIITKHRKKIAKEQEKLKTKTGEKPAISATSENELV